MTNDKKNEQKTGLGKPDPETLHTTDPQEEMKGPISSFMNNIKDEIEEEGGKVNPDEDEKKD